ncbi:sensor histidine kinase [Nitrosospira briensis]|uniref:histidine kinase n=1 Tax=Nitrosospira briensis TaxID=35799 RepID=A0A1I5APE4_9PROT|nr:ATP-binding protein [Nitrosospira briensis]SFN64305.1 Signal transduction histidine kinase involved in nitrogen fixation and metabolism regulation [Nitrosospira briensis]SFN88115.1 Signal transduction histidine kinase involved in nitrogen fixation and metabolism regulation [Nitrosospira briensis]
MEYDIAATETFGQQHAVKYVIIISAGLGAVMLFLLATAGADTGLFDRKYRLLIRLNVGFVLFLMAVVGYLLWRLRRRLNAGVFGSRLALRLLLIFSLMAVLPGALVYGISVQFLGKSIESWFDVKVDRALEGGLNLGRNILDNLVEDLHNKARTTALTLSEQSEPPLLTLSRLVKQSQIQEATLFDYDGSVAVFSRADDTAPVPQALSTALMHQLKTEESYRAVESIPGKGLYLKVLMPIQAAEGANDSQVLQLLQPVPKQLAEDAEIVQGAFRDYQELLLSREGLKSLYGVTLTLALLLSLFSALAAAFLISERLSAPLGMLAEGTRAVAQGDFSRRHPVQSRDELGVLTESFNLMTHQLEEARTMAQRHQQEVESARAYLENVLANLSSGVLVFDENLRMRTGNLSAEQILKVPLSGLQGLTIEECAMRQPQLDSFKTEILEGFHSGKKGEWQCQLERSRDGANQVLLLRGTRLPDESGGGGVVVFDDITNLLQAQRTAAWGEVARRLAHEIKNPLTPIQLSAERVQHKLADKLGRDDAQILRRSTETIVNQVEALKKMVNEFSEYARAPELEFHLLDFNGLVREILALYEAAGSATPGNPQPRIYLTLAPDLPAVRGDSARLRQVIHNLLQNAQDTLIGVAEPAIMVRTEPAPGGIRFSVSDNGGGFSEQVRARVFEPYVTTKSKGTGLGLPIVKKIIEEHRGMIQIENIQPRGARISITLPATRKNSVDAYRTAM